MDPIAARRLEEKERRRTEILDAAELVAASTGLESLTMEQVAREARLSRGLLYVYFRDKDDLQAGICERALISLHTRLKAIAEESLSGLDQALAMGRAYVDFAARSPVQFEMLARHEATDLSAMDTGSNHHACLAAGLEVQQLLTGALEAGIRDGSVARSAGSSNTVALALWAMTHGTIQVASMKRAVLKQLDVTPEDLVEQTLRMAMISLRRGE